uniref:Uncharacterized protein n=1 Tax=Ditylenchus dipsaci TaxID=166011 RepID=A0A915D5B4_9BILA
MEEQEKLNKLVANAAVRALEKTCFSNVSALKELLAVRRPITPKMKGKALSLKKETKGTMGQTNRAMEAGIIEIMKETTGEIDHNAKRIGETV